METLTYRRFLSTADAGWAAAYRLYEASFPPCERRSERDYDAALADGRLYAAVSYTHLTLPTKA